MLKEVLPIGKKIKKLRKQNGLSQDWLSKPADIPHNMIIKDVSVDNLLK
jgi:predicted transcriptional regulator